MLIFFYYDAKYIVNKKIVLVCVEIDTNGYKLIDLIDTPPRMDNYS